MILAMLIFIVVLFLAARVASSLDRQLTPCEVRSRLRDEAERMSISTRQIKQSET